MTEGKPMTPDEILRELDEIPWAELQQAFGKADDDPRLLRAIVADGEDAAEALWELSSALVHQGTVWPATRYAVPFLARIAAAGIGDASHVVGTLGFIADSAIDAGFEPPEDARLGPSGRHGPCGHALPVAVSRRSHGPSLDRLDPREV